GTQNSEFDLGFSSNSLNQYAYVSVLAPDGTTVVNPQYLPAGSPGQWVVVKPPLTGTYQVVVQPQSAGTGSVTVTLSAPVAGSLSTSGAGVVANVSRPGQEAVLTFSGTQNSEFDLGFSSNSLNQYAYVSVLAPDGTTVVNQQYLPAGSPGQWVVVKPPLTGTYQVVVQPQSAGTGSVTVTLSAPVAGSLSTSGAGVVANVSRPGQEAVLTFSGTQNSEFDLGFSSNSLNQYAYVSVLAPDGTTVVNQQYLPAGSPGQWVVVKPPLTGTYQVVVQPQSAGTGSVTVTLSAPVAGSLSTSGAGVVANVSRPGQEAVLTFSGTQNSEFDLGFSSNSLNQYAYVSVLAPDGTTVVNPQYLPAGSPGQWVVVKPPLTGTYQVVVQPQSAGTGSVTVTLSAPVAGSLSTSGAGVVANVSRPGQEAVLTFSGTQNSEFDLGFSSNSLNQYAYVSVLAPDGTTVVNQQYLPAGSPGQWAIAKPPLTGTYQVVVQPQSVGTGSVTVTLSAPVAGAVSTAGAGAAADVSRAAQG